MDTLSSLIERVADEAREPLRAALAAAESLRKPGQPADAEHQLDTITEAAAGVIAMLDAAADLRRASSGHFPLATEPRRLQDLMDDVERGWRGRAEAAGVTLMVAYDGDPDCSALVDYARVMQVFDALIGHALAHVRHGVVEASVKVRTTETGITVHGRIRDNDARYTPDYLAGLFDVAGVPDASGGVAVTLGLALAGRAIAAMGGKLAAESNVGSGATMTFDITLRAAGMDEDDAATPAEPVRSAHILVVDDNATNRMVVEALCEMFDCSSESVVDGIEAVEAARTGHFDVILMDIKMPRMDGVTAAREIRKLGGAAGATPIIALTANADPDEVAQYLAAGMHSVVEKPIKPERLMEALDAVLSGGPAHEAAAVA